MLGIAHTLEEEGLCDREFLARYCEGYERFEAYLTGAADGQPKDAPGPPHHRVPAVT